MKVELGNIWNLNEMKNRLMLLSTNVFLSTAVMSTLISSTSLEQHTHAHTHNHPPTHTHTYIYIYIYIYICNPQMHKAITHPIGADFITIIVLGRSKNHVALSYVILFSLLSFNPFIL